MSHSQDHHYLIYPSSPSPFTTNSPIPSNTSQCPSIPVSSTPTFRVPAQQPSSSFTSPLKIYLLLHSISENELLIIFMYTFTVTCHLYTRFPNTNTASHCFYQAQCFRWPCSCQCYYLRDILSSIVYFYFSVFTFVTDLCNPARRNTYKQISSP